MTRQPRKFRYDAERRKRGVLRLMRAFEFPDLIKRAEAGDTGLLREYLQSNDPLSEDHRLLLAGLIYRRIQRKGRGKRGEAERPYEDAVRLVAYEIRRTQAKRGWRNLSEARLTQLFEEVGDRLGNNDFFVDLKNDITIDDVRGALRHIRRR